MEFFKFISLHLKVSEYLNALILGWHLCKLIGYKFLVQFIIIFLLLIIFLLALLLLFLDSLQDQHFDIQLSLEQLIEKTLLEEYILFDWEFLLFKLGKGLQDGLQEHLFDGLPLLKRHKAQLHPHSHPIEHLDHFQVQLLLLQFTGIFWHEQMVIVLPFFDFVYLFFGKFGLVVVEN